MELTFAAATDIGRQRTHNEDNFLIDKKLRLFLVADGMGGHAAGEVASAMAVDTVRQTLEAARPEIDAFKKAAADINMTPAAYADWLARSPAGMLQPDQQALKKQLESQGNKPVRSEAERKEIDKALGADPADVTYRKNAAALTAQLQSGHEDADILAKYGAMTPGQQKLFKEEFEKVLGDFTAV